MNGLAYDSHLIKRSITIVAIAYTLQDASETFLDFLWMVDWPIFCFEIGFAVYVQVVITFSRQLVTMRLDIISVVVTGDGRIDRAPKSLVCVVAVLAIPVLGFVFRECFLSSLCRWCCVVLLQCIFWNFLEFQQILKALRNGGQESL